MSLNNGDVQIAKQRSDERFFMNDSFPAGKQMSRQAYTSTAKYTAVICITLEGLA